ncbi:MAG: SHOCT domain-containing protein [Anaerolineae bacterium]|nr:SHOCT domain-containing protein [Anaerolineae bacterium]
MKPEDLSEQQLEQALNDLEIDTDELTDAEVAAMEADDDAPAAAATPSAPAAPAAPPDDYITQLERLGALRDQGILTDEEFEAKKRQILGL